MADEITFSGLEGKYTYDYRLLQESIVDALYPANNLLQFLNQKSLAGFASDSERFPKEPTLAAAALTDGTDMSNTAYSPTQVTISVGEVGLLLTLTDLARTSSIADISLYGSGAGKAVMKKLMTDIGALGAGFSSSVGTSTQNLTEAQFLAAKTTLILADVMGSYYAVLYPQQLEDLVVDTGTTINALATGAGGPVRSEANDLSLKQSHDYGMFHGVHIVTNTQVATANANADSAGWMAEAGTALAYVEKWGVRVEQERDASLRGTEIAVTAAYGVGEIDDSRGVGIVTDR